MNRPPLRFLLLLAAVAASCDNPSGPRLVISVDQLAGSWVMQQNTAIQIADTTKQIDLMALDGIDYDSLAIAKGGTFINSFKTVLLTGVDTGTITVANGILIWEVMRGGTPMLPLLRFQVAASGNDMIMSGIDTSYADFNNDRLLDPAHGRIRWRRS